MFISKLLLLASSLYLTATASTAKNASVPDDAKASSGQLCPDLMQAMTNFTNNNTKASSGQLSPDLMQAMTNFTNNDTKASSGQLSPDLMQAMTTFTNNDAKASSGQLSPDLMQAMTNFTNDDAINSGVSCAGCRALLDLLQQVATSEDRFVTLGKEACDIMTSPGPGRWREMCHQSMAEHGPIAAIALRNMGNVRKSDAAGLFCNNVLQVCPVVNPKVDLYVAPLPPRPPWHRPLVGMKPWEIIHFSDMHLDPEYQAGTSAECGDHATCCRNASMANPSGETVLAGRYGHPKTCDTPSTLEDSMYEAMGQHAGGALFGIYTGDIVGRQGWNSSAAGNEERRGEVPSKYSIDWLYSVLTKVWKSHFSAERYSPAYRGRYVYAHNRRNLRVIGFNTNLYSRSNLWLYKEPLNLDPEGQLQWLARQLRTAESLEQNVYLVGHMPMGDVDVMRHSSNAFNRIITRFNKTVIHMFFGHTHLDQVQLNYGTNATQLGVNAIATSYIAPSITPSHGNPAFKIYKVDERRNTILDSLTISTDINDPSFKTKPKWHESYNIKSAYGSHFTPGATYWHQELLPLNWHKLLKLWEKNSTLFNHYWRNKYTDPLVEACDDECRRKEICLMRGGRAEDNCAGFTPGVKLGRTGKLGSRSPPVRVSHEQVNSCGASVVFDAFGVLFDPDVQALIRQVVHG
ncbi:hypothetical protein EsDP_00006237 [Epichloe bromicola]|uniref:Sphingomyelin phosphodiesterase n=1 Tax=Epichloe bromicola TaxID=79588 RepID=A0ABQ0CX35_9HYPO